MTFTITIEGQTFHEDHDTIDAAGYAAFQHMSDLAPPDTTRSDYFLDAKTYAGKTVTTVVATFRGLNSRTTKRATISALGGDQ